MPRTKPAVKAIIERNSKILALKTEAGGETYWVLPGGKVEYGEPPEKALERELEEEISCSADIGAPFGMYHFFVGPESDGNQIVLTAFEVDIGDQEIDIGDNPADENIVEYRWMTPRELMARTSNESLRELVRDYFFDTPKLVRDRIPEIAEENGDLIETEILGEDRIEDYLGDKLVEEAHEFSHSGDIEELADLMEVFETVLERNNFSKEKIEEIRDEKKEERGGFSRGILLKDTGKEK